MPKLVSHKHQSVMSSPGTSWAPWILGVLLCFVVLASEQAGWLGWKRLAHFSIDPGIRLQSISHQVWLKGRQQWQFWQEGAARLAQLENDFARLQIDRAELSRLHQENQQLGSTNTVAHSNVLARWYGSKNNWFVSVGCTSGVVVQSPVLFQGALVGQVSEVTPNYSRVQTWDDPSWRLAVKVGTQSAQGVFHSERGLWEVTDVLRGNAVESKSTVVTAGQGLLPGDVPLASVDSVREETGFGTLSLIVQPLLRLEELRWVEVLPGTGGDVCSG